MRVAIAAGLSLCLAFSAAGAATKPAPKASAEKGPPACAAIHFRPVAAGAGDGEQPAGMYKSRFGRLELTAAVKGGAATGYRVGFNGKPLADAPSPLPPTAAACAAKKKMPAPGQAASACTGDGFTVVIDHEAKERVALLYARQSNNWQFCSAGSF